MTILSTQNVRKIYGTGENEVHALDDGINVLSVRLVAVQLYRQHDILIYIEHRHQIVVLEHYQLKT